MNKWITSLAIGLAAFTMLLVPLHQVSADAVEVGRGPGGQGGRGTGPIGTGSEFTSLTDQEAKDLQSAIVEEYGALNLYTAIQEKFGTIYPFDIIAQSEQSHVDALIRQAQKYGVSVPERPELPDISQLATVQAACSAGVDAEITDAALYDTILANTDKTDLTRVYENLQWASLNRHLPAFQTCQ